ncbi:hypothetical protein [Arcobacter venerupis]|nr:hypothetical protein [Arcobacter venerupis]
MKKIKFIYELLKKFNKVICIDININIDVDIVCILHFISNLFF